MRLLPRLIPTFAEAITLANYRARQSGVRQRVRACYHGPDRCPGRWFQVHDVTSPR